MFFQQFITVWASLELFMALTHLFVFLGFKNSKLGFLRRQQNYFLLDAMTHLTNALLYPIKTAGIVLYGMWLVAIVIHLRYYHNLKSNPPPRHNRDGEMEEDNSYKIPRIFHWSCVEYQANRFSIFQSGREILETTIDVVAHSAGFLFAFQQIESTGYKIFAFILMLAFFYRQMLGLKYFITDPKMMPPLLQRFFTDYSATAMAN